MTHDELDELLRLRAVGGDVEAIDRRVWERFGARRAVLISDMSGFSRLTEGLGIVHCLGLIHRMGALCRPLIEREGRLVKAEADNLLAVFEEPGMAVAAARAMVEACRLDGASRAPEDRVQVCLGIGWGDVLDLDGQDVFGDEVNLASRLGEDLAGPGEILLTNAAWEAVHEPAERCELRVSGVDVTWWRLTGAS